MADYRQVADALASGADPAMICMTCPWDRFCINPPSMTADEIQRQRQEMEEQDRIKAEKNRLEGKESGMPMGMLLSTIMLSGKDTSAQVCPVFAMRLRTNDGAEVVASIRKAMKSIQD